MNDILKKLFAMAKEASNNAYAPYSGFKVGAALLTDKGNIFTGCNIENASYSLTICAERVAVSKAVSADEKVFKAVAVYVQSEKVFPPCGACRQVLFEFSEDTEIVYGNDEQYFISSIKELLPNSFKL